MEYYQGCLIDHVHLRIADVEESRRLYQAVFLTVDDPNPRSYLP